MVTTTAHPLALARARELVDPSVQRLVAESDGAVLIVNRQAR